jgi:hypothetical protein
MKEWKDVNGYKGLYKISNHGDVFSCRYGKLMSPGRVRQYNRLALCKNGIRKNYLVHRLVLLNFIGMPPKNKPEAMHLDGNPQNNYIGNLQWGSHIENMKMDHGNNHSFEGEKNENSKLTIAQVKHIRAVYNHRATCQWGREKLAKLYNISTQQVSRIAHQSKGGWQHV